MASGVGRRRVRTGALISQNPEGMNMPLRAIRCMLMRGGTSRGPYFRLNDLPADPAIRDRVLLAAMGSPDLRQIDGLGGSDPLTSKVAMVSPSSEPGCDVDYLFAQVAIDKAIVDTNPPCGNMMAGVGPFAIESGMVTPKDGETRVMIYHVNIKSRIEAIIQTPGGHVEYEGEAAIDGVPGSAAPVVLNFMDVVGSKTGGVCVASACVLDGSIAWDLAVLPIGNPRTIRIEHPSGQIHVRLETRGQGADLQVVSAGLLRTARKLMSGEVYVPARLWEQPMVADLPVPAASIAASSRLEH